MDNVVKVAAVLDESDEGRSGVNNNVNYDGVDGHWGGTLRTIIMDGESMVCKTLPPPFFCESLLSLAVARKLSVHEIDNFSQGQTLNIFTNFKDVINSNRLPLLATIQLVFNGMQEICQGSQGCVASLWVTLSRHVGAACWRSGYAKRVTLTKNITEAFTDNSIFFFQRRCKKWQRYQTSGASVIKKTEFV
jgi:hypothetical protein